MIKKREKNKKREQMSQEIQKHITGIRERITGMNFIINEEFAKLIPPLSSEELHNLEQSLLKEGCLHALVVWNNTIIDGHHRYAICTKHDISFEVVEKSELESELDVKLWMINNQFSRRNLPTETRLALAYRFKEFEAEKAKERQGTRNDLIEIDINISKPVYTSSDSEDPKNENTEKGRALEAIAKRAGVSHMTAFQYDKIQQQGTEEQKAEVAEGKSSIKKVYTQIQKANRSEQNKSKSCSKLPGDFIAVIQQDISNIYNVLDGYRSSEDLQEIYHWADTKYFKYNENFCVIVPQVDKQVKIVTRNLTQLSESVDNMEICVNQCKSFISREIRKNPKFSEAYNLYHAKLNGVVNESKM